MRRKFLLFFLFLLQGCAVFGKTGFVLPKDENGYKCENVFCLTAFEIPYDQKKYGSIYSETETKYFWHTEKGFYLHTEWGIQDDQGYSWTWYWIFPVYKGVGDGINPDSNFVVYLDNISNDYTEDFLNNLEIELRNNGKKNQASKKVYNCEYSNKVEKVEFVFGVSFNDVKEYGAELVIRYKNFYKIIDLEYRLMKYKFAAV